MLLRSCGVGIPGHPSDVGRGPIRDAHSKVGVVIDTDIKLGMVACHVPWLRSCALTSELSL